MKKNPKKFWRAETLLEVLIALGVVASGAAIAAQLTIQALSANQYNKDQLVALNLAKTGIEYLINTVDSNFIRFSYDKTNCWDQYPNVSNCADTQIIQKGNYAFSVGGLISYTSALDLSNGVDSSDSDFVLKNVNFAGVNLITSLPSPTPPGITDNGPTKFYMDINVDYKVDTNGVISNSVQPNYKDANLMVVTATVQWLDGNQLRQVKTSTVISNYKEWN